MRMILLVVWLCFVSNPLIGQQNEPKAKKRDPVAQQYEKNPQQSAAPIEVHIGGPVEVKTSNGDQKAPQEKPVPFMTHGEWVMAILTLAYVVISFFSFRAIKNQSKTAKQAADAASANAVALMNAERAWVVVAVKGTMGTWRPDDNATEIVFSNVGKTPALINEVIVKTERVRSIQDVSGSAQEGAVIDEMKDVLVAPGEHLAIPISVDQSMSSAVVVRGIVKYSDANKRPWCTRFLYLCDYVRLNQAVFFRRIPHGYYNSYGEGYESQPEGQGNIDSNPL